MGRQRRHTRRSKYGRRFGAGRGSSSAKASTRVYRIWVKPDGEEFYEPTPIVFRNKVRATTFANIETTAGMGEDYEVRISRTKSGDEFR